MYVSDVVYKEKVVSAITITSTVITASLEAVSVYLRILNNKIQCLVCFHNQNHAST